MPPSPVLRTARLRLEPFAEPHLTERYVGWLNDPDVVRFSEQRHRRHTLASCEAYWRSFEGTPHHFWAIAAEDPSLGHIGNINAYLDPRNSVADIGLLIGNKAVWGQGYGREAWQAVCRYLLDSGTRKVTGGTIAPNTGMLRIMEQCGMQPDGVRRAHLVVDGHPVDMIHMALFQDARVAP